MTILIFFLLNSNLAPSESLRSNETYAIVYVEIKALISDKYRALSVMWTVIKPCRHCAQ
jgi:hypothetical protein